MTPDVPRSRNYIGSKLCISVEEQESLRLFVGPCFSQLLYDQKSIGISRDIEVQDLTPVMADDEKAVLSNPEQLVQGNQSTARSTRVQSQQLLAKSEIFKDEVLPGFESANYLAKEMPERHNHGKNLTGKRTGVGPHSVAQKTRPPHFG